MKFILFLCLACHLLAANTDLRHEELGLGANNQGPRPSCMVFAIVGALEYAWAQKSGTVVDLSEDYAIWATFAQLKSHTRTARARLACLGSQRDLGFSSWDVVAGLKAYGIADLKDFNNKIMGGTLEAPTAELMEAAKKRSHFEAIWIKSQDNTERIAAILALLEQKHPVVVGMAWPLKKTLEHETTLAEQKPQKNNGHAVLLLGYQEAGDGGGRFIFRNSWGRRWGENGYGYITYAYMQKHLKTALYLSLDN